MEEELCGTVALVQFAAVPQSVLVPPLQIEVVWPSSDPATPKNIADTEKIPTALRNGEHTPFANIELAEANDKRRTGREFMECGGILG